MTARPPRRLPKMTGFGRSGCRAASSSTDRARAATTSRIVWPSTGSWKTITNEVDRVSGGSCPSRLLPDTIAAGRLGV
jgi:hypothetical protein